MHLPVLTDDVYLNNHGILEIRNENGRKNITELLKTIQKTHGAPHNMIKIA